MNQNFEIIRKCLETTYSHVTFLKSVPTIGANGLTDSIVTYWTVTESAIEFSVGYNGESQVHVTNEKCYVYGFGLSDYIASKLFTKIENKKVENKMEKLAGIELNVLRNGVRVLKNGIENDFNLAQSILDVNEYARNVDAETAYVERDYKHYECTYEVKVARSDDYEEFTKMLRAERCYTKKRGIIVSQYQADKIEYREYRERVEALSDCECGVCKVKIPTLNEWKTGIIEFSEWNEFTSSFRTKQIKLGKYLVKQGIEQQVIDFYATQVKDEKTVYLTITSAPQFVAGMSYFAKARSWDGYNGTSCMDTRHGGSYSVKLGGALADNMLHVAFLHNELSDLQDMTDKMIARVVMRPIDVEGEIALIPTRYYGNNVTKDMLNYTLNQLNEMLIYGTNITGEIVEGDDIEDFMESVDSGYDMCMTEQVNVYENNWVTVSCSCPACDGEGSIDREVESSDGSYRDVTFECPMCEGSGEYETEVQVEYDEYVDVETEQTVYCYYENEGDHYEFDEYRCQYTMTVNESQIQRDILEYVSTTIG